MSRILFNLTFWSILANLPSRSKPLETELSSRKEVYFMSLHLISHTFTISKTSSSENMYKPPALALLSLYYMSDGIIS